MTKLEKELILKYASMLAYKIKDSGNYKLYNLFENPEFNFYPSRYDNLNYGTTYYTFELKIQYDKYMNISYKEKADYIKIMENILSDLFDDENNVLEYVKILPKIEQFIDWSKLEDISNKEEFMKLLIKEKEYLISVGTGKISIEDCDEEYKKCHEIILNICSKLSLNPPTNFNSCWDWYNFYKKNLDTYQKRRTYLNEKYANLIKIISESQDNISFINITKTGFNLIDESVKILQNDINKIHDKISCNEIGLRCRETLILLAKEIYNDEKRHPTTYQGEISNTDSKKMIDGFIEHELGGSNNETKRKYAKATNDLANELTHKQNPSLNDVKLCISATLSLIQMIKIILEIN